MSEVTDAQSMALEMFKGNVPCIVSVESGCSNKAAWLIELVHVDKEECGEMQPNPAPFCGQHKNMMVQSFNPFWRTYMNTPPTLCEFCGAELGLGEVKRIDV